MARFDCGADLDDNSGTLDLIKLRWFTSHSYIKASSVAACNKLLKPHMSEAQVQGLVLPWTSIAFSHAVIPLVPRFNFTLSFYPICQVVNLCWLLGELGCQTIFEWTTLMAAACNLAQFVLVPLRWSV